MSRDYGTPQEEFWAGDFGDEYIGRNRSPRLLASNIALFSRVFGKTRKLDSMLELGANIGLNLQAIQSLFPEIKLSAVEINEKAVQHLRSLQGIHVFHQSILDFMPDRQYDAVLVKTVLIHINPEFLEKVYEVLYRASGKYICVVEYYNPMPVEVSYRGHQERLFKRDFAGELLDRYPDLRLQDYGFVYHGDVFPQDDVTWFLLEKR
jgi:spore coat polysaccharide biosynthesis protein SpsF